MIVDADRLLSQRKAGANITVGPSLWRSGGLGWADPGAGRTKAPGKVEKFTLGGASEMKHRAGGQEQGACSDGIRLEVSEWDELASGGSLGLAHTPAFSFRRLLVVGRALHIADQTFLLAQLLKASNHLLDGFAGTHFDF